MFFHPRVNWSGLCVMIAADSAIQGIRHVFRAVDPLSAGFIAGVYCAEGYTNSSELLNFSLLLMGVNLSHPAEVISGASRALLWLSGFTASVFLVSLLRHEAAQLPMESPEIGRMTLGKR